MCLFNVIYMAYRHLGRQYSLQPTHHMPTQDLHHCDSLLGILLYRLCYMLHIPVSTYHRHSSCSLPNQWASSKILTHWAYITYAYLSRQTQDVEPRFSVTDNGPTLNQHYVNVRVCRVRQLHADKLVVPLDRPTDHVWLMTTHAQDMPHTAVT